MIQKEIKLKKIFIIQMVVYSLNITYKYDSKGK